VFGMTEDEGPLTEGDAARPSTHYGAFKGCNEDNARVYYFDNGVNSIGLRPLTIYGVGRDFGLTSDPTKAMKATVVGRPFHLRFGGRTDFQYIADTADIFIRAATSDLLGAHVFNLRGVVTSIDQIVAEIHRLVPSASISAAGEVPPIAAELEPHDVELRLHHDVTATLKVRVESTTPLPPPAEAPAEGRREDRSDRHDRRGRRGEVRPDEGAEKAGAAKGEKTEKEERKPRAPRSEPSARGERRPKAEAKAPKAEKTEKTDKAE